MQFSEKFNLFDRWVKYSMAREKRQTRSHWWFAWYPIKLECGGYAWLEPVDRDRVHRSGENYSISYWRYYSRK